MQIGANGRGKGNRIVLMHSVDLTNPVNSCWDGEEVGGSLGGRGDSVRSEERMGENSRTGQRMVGLGGECGRRGQGQEEASRGP